MLTEHPDDDQKVVSSSSRWQHLIDFLVAETYWSSMLGYDAAARTAAGVFVDSTDPSEGEENVIRPDDVQRFFVLERSEFDGEWRLWATTLADPDALRRQIAVTVADPEWRLLDVIDLDTGKAVPFDIEIVLHLP